MIRKNVWGTSIFVFLIAVTLAYQNCNNKKFNTMSENSIAAGSVINSIDSGGNIDGQVNVKSCEDKEKSDSCPDTVKVRIYAFDKNNNKKLLGEVDAEQIIQDNKIVFTFTFVIGKDYACYKIKAYVVDPVLNVEVEIPYSPSYKVSTFNDKCASGGDDDSGGGGGGGGGSGNPMVDINGVDKDGRLVQVNGKCTVGASVVFSGDINSMIDTKDKCTGGTIKYCNLINKYQQDNTIAGKQDLGGKQANDNTSVKWSDSPVKVITYDTFSVDNDETNITITGHCNPTDIVKVSAYGGATKGQTTCDSNGTYSIKAPILIPGLKNKGREVAGQGVNSAAVGGNTPIITYDPDKDITPSCAITSTVPNASICSQQAGTVKGSCQSGLPVIVSVNGNMQNIGYCEGGQFEVKNVLLQAVGVANAIKIEQKTPYGKSCSSTKSLNNF